MKKNKVYLIMSAFVIASCCALTGCGKTNTEISEASKNQELNIDEGSKKTESSSENKATVDSNTSKLDTNSVEGNTVESKMLNKIQYPVFKGIKNEEKINKIVLDYVNKINDEYSYDDGGKLNSEYKIMFKNDKYISIYFTGDITGSASYVRKVKASLNIDIENSSAMKLSDITNINDAFINKVTKGIEAEFKALDLEESPYTTEIVKSKLQDADNNGEYLSDVQSYFTNDNVVIILGVQHAIGDYMEISISKSSVENKMK